jgi:hypothetical protein
VVGLISFNCFDDRYEGLVASRAGCFYSFDTTTNKQIMGRSAHVAAEDLSSIRIAFGTAYNSDADFGVGAATTIFASFEYPAGTFTRITWNTGATSIVAVDRSFNLSDYVAVSIPSGATFWVRMYATSTGGILFNTWQNVALGEATAVGVTGVADRTMTGTVTDTGQGYSFRPLGILGITRNPSVIIAGDSIGYGNNDTFSATAHDDKVGLVARSLGSVPFVNLSVASMQAKDWAAQATVRGQMATKGSHLICQLGTNDIAAGFTAAQTITAVQAIWATARPGAKVYQCTLLPRDTGNFTIAPASANQTHTAGSSDRILFNQTIRAGGLGLKGYYDTESILHDALDSDYWLPNASTLTADGTHPSVGGYALVQSSGIIPVPTWP